MGLDLRGRAGKDMSALIVCDWDMIFDSRLWSSKNLVLNGELSATSWSAFDLMSVTAIDSRNPSQARIHMRLKWSRTNNTVSDTQQDLQKLTQCIAPDATLFVVERTLIVFVPGYWRYLVINMDWISDGRPEITWTPKSNKSILSHRVGDTSYWKAKTKTSFGEYSPTGGPVSECDLLARGVSIYEYKIEGPTTRLRILNVSDFGEALEKTMCYRPTGAGITTDPAEVRDTTDPAEVKDTNTRIATTATEVATIIPRLWGVPEKTSETQGSKDLIEPSDLYITDWLSKSSLAFRPDLIKSNVSVLERFIFANRHWNPQNTSALWLPDRDQCDWLAFARLLAGHGFGYSSVPYSSNCLNTRSRVRLRDSGWVPLDIPK